MQPIQHLLYSQNKEIVIAYFDKFDKEKIKKAIIEHLTQNPEDTIEHCKSYNAKDARKYYGYEILNFYATSPKTKKPAKIVTKGNKEYYQTLN